MLLAVHLIALFSPQLPGPLALDHVPLAVLLAQPGSEHFNTNHVPEKEIIFKAWSYTSQ